MKTPKQLRDLAEGHLKELVPEATSISFEEMTLPLVYDVPKNAVIIALSYRDPGLAGLSHGLLSKRMKSLYLNPETGDLLAVKNKLG